jgi:drug/metabolite transporter (DMT)-like permease
VTLIGRIGTGRTGYVTVLMPLVALVLSTLFEGYSWTIYAFAGVALVLAGNVIVLSTPSKA